MLLEIENLRRNGKSISKMSTTLNSRHLNGHLTEKDGELSPSYRDDDSIKSVSSKSVVQCYSVSTGKVSTLLRSPSQSSISSIEVAEINNMSEFMNNSTKGHQQIRAVESSSPPFVKFNPICQKPGVFNTIPEVKAVFSAIPEVKVEEGSKVLRKCSESMNRLDHLEHR